MSKAIIVQPSTSGELGEIIFLTVLSAWKMEPAVVWRKRNEPRKFITVLVVAKSGKSRKEVKTGPLLIRLRERYCSLVLKCEGDRGRGL
jgi:hypothetical protein